MSTSGDVRLEITGAINSFKFNEAGYIALLQNEVGRDLARRAVRVESAAKQNATGAPGPNVRTGRLRGSITWRLGSESGVPYADVGTAVVYAPYVELGTSRMKARPFLRPALQAARD